LKDKPIIEAIGFDEYHCKELLKERGYFGEFELKSAVLLINEFENKGGY